MEKKLFLRTLNKGFGCVVNIIVMFWFDAGMIYKKMQMKLHPKHI